jgi:hypothetical protein
VWAILSIPGIDHRGPGRYSHHTLFGRHLAKLSVSISTPSCPGASSRAAVPSWHRRPAQAGNLFGVRTHGYHSHDIDMELNVALILVAQISLGVAAMAWVRGHYARSPRKGRRSKSRLSLIIAIAIAAIVIIWLISLN